MAIAFGSSITSSIFFGGPYSQAISTTGSNILMLVSTFNTAHDTTTLDYNGVTGTKIGEIQRPVGSFFFQLWAIIVGAGVGSANVTCDGSGTLVLQPFYYTGVKQSIPTNVSTNAVTGNTNFSTTLTIAVNNSWAAMCGGANPNTVTAGSGTTLRENSISGGAFCGDSNGALGTGSDTMNVSRGTSTNWAGIMTELEAFAAPPSGSLFRKSALVGLGSGGQFFQNPLNYPSKMMNKAGKLYVPSLDEVEYYNSRKAA